MVNIFEKKERKKRDAHQVLDVHDHDGERVVLVDHGQFDLTLDHPGRGAGGRLLCKVTEQG